MLEQLDSLCDIIIIILKLILAAYLRNCHIDNQYYCSDIVGQSNVLLKCCHNNKEISYACSSTDIVAMRQRFTVLGLFVCVCVLLQVYTLLDGYIN